MNIFPILLAFLGIIMLQIGLIIQKKSLQNSFSLESISNKENLIKNWLLQKSITHWIFGTILTFIGAFLGFYAISISSVSIIQPLIGIGPIILALILTVVFREKIGRKLWLAITLSAIGVLFIVFYSVPGNNNITLDYYEQQLIFISIIIAVLVIFIGYILYSVQNIQLGVTEAIIGGLLGGLPSLYAKIAVPKINELHLHWTIVALIITQFLAFVFLQRGIQKGSLTIVSSVFMAFSIVVPVFIAFLWLAEQISLIHIIGTVLILSSAIYFIYNNPSEDTLPYPISAYPSANDLIENSKESEITSS
ncbi:MAG: hypothetical protein HeimC3_35030 [Candidatus Heimdallarchaeota archaeon LC_3]|nr:MAG: hypothetical protein HeimC3_35030 [Candidatus Heimdallarchaeota archaeon LC_3]